MNRKLLIIGANGQLGKALQAQYPDAQALDTNQLDISDRQAVDSYNWEDVTTILNAAAYTNVDGAETAEGREAAWATNATAPAHLARQCIKHGITLVHISTDYVFDGTRDPHTEDEAYAPLSVYGQTKAAGDIAVSLNPQHYILRTSWVIGDGKNFVRTMLGLGQKGVDPKVVSDQIGRLTFTTELARVIDYLLANRLPYGTYNVSNDGPPASWADITRQIFAAAQLERTVTDISTAEYYKDKPEAAPRPLKSTLDLTKIKSVGFEPADWQDNLKTYLQKELA
ncbi:MAG: dTDP-4-dehydrorhamnose reductase [Candidatus Saccharibacteria bacterium]|nr:dTDP-4-dehydrorhamnose reductase [Candidatus Saccharibacteria bacterium]